MGSMKEAKGEGGRRGADPLELFSPPVARWFREALGKPTPAQELGWPVIASGHHTLILAPTGSGKTLASFLWALDELLTGSPSAVHTLYISPLKALGYDIERNLEKPLDGIRSVAQAMGIELPEVRVGVRTGDTSPAERQRLLRHPPHILITTPESLHLLLTSTRARETLVRVCHVIVDEVHALAPTKRGTFLAVLLERLEALCGRPFQRIGLSATIRPLGAVARFLGGTDSGRERPVKVVDAGLRKELDLQVVSAVQDMTALPEDSIWPSIYVRLLELILAHRSTIVFVNNRRAAERIAAELNELAGSELVQVHHGSVAKERRRELEEKLKAGELPALVATASLELGIDMGLVDLVVQVESPHGVARGLQRVGRAGHLFRIPSRGRLLPKTRGDLLEMAACARAMRNADIESVRIPTRCLDILAQQIVAIVAGGPTPVQDLFQFVRRAYPYHDLPYEAFLSTVGMLAGEAGPWPVRPRLAWDRVNNVLHPLPGSRQLALTSGGAIPETGQYGVYTEAGERIGELDEEFVYEARVGELVQLGADRWRILDITHDRVLVSPGEGPAKIPFWKGEAYGRDVHLGRAVGELAREIEERLEDPDLKPWLEEECALDPHAAENLRRYIADQKIRSAVPTDKKAVIEGFPDEAGGLRLAILTPLGTQFHLALRLALLARFREELGVHPDSLHGATGILLRLTQVPFERAVALLRSIRAEDVERLVLSELGGSPLFGLRFRENAGRALLLPRQGPRKRTPLWLRRLSARDLLEAARASPGFPIVTETYREILSESLPMAELGEWLRGVGSGEVELALRQGPAPSPFAASLLWEFQAVYLYQWDEPKPGPVPAGLTEEELGELLDRDLTTAVDPGVVDRVEGDLRGVGEGRWARTGAEILALVKRLGDVTEDELALAASPEARAALPGLIAGGTLARIEFRGAERPERIVAGEELPMYRAALAGDEGAQAEAVRRHASSRALVSLVELHRRYPFPPEVVEATLAAGPFVGVTWHGERCWTRPETLERLRRLTLAARRSRLRAHAPAALQAHVLRRQHLSPRTRLSGPEGLAQVLRELQGIALPWSVWDREALPARVAGYRSTWGEELLQSGEFLWLGRPGPGGDLAVTFARREDLFWLLNAYPPPGWRISPEAEAVLARLGERGASFLVELAGDLRMPAAALAHLLWELARAGLVTNDGLGPLRAGPPPVRPAKNRIWSGGMGRWSALPKPKGNLSEQEMERLVRLLLARYGILSRQILALDGAAIPWGDLYRLLSRLEWRGEVERGLFVDGLVGAQFALKEALADLGPSHGEWVLVPAADPAVLYGAGAPFPLPHPLDPAWRLRRGAGSYLVLKGGVAALALEGFGERVAQLAELSESELNEGLTLLPRLVEGPRRRITVRSWNGQPVWSTPVERILRTLGFQRGPEALILYRRYGTQGRPA